ncbi:MAG: hypothetical protein BWY67_01210 [Bacteroidetes bacterium ADurb.Bin397]|nr:MAG: hypothetical protein BWY67_01210 [Bacteroidetes bacterium ADurb.Bin397]
MLPYIVVFQYPEQRKKLRKVLKIRIIQVISSWFLRYFADANLRNPTRIT